MGAIIRSYHGGHNPHDMFALAKNRECNLDILASLAAPDSRMVDTEVGKPLKNV